MSDEHIYIYLSINDIRLQVISSFLQGQYILSLEINRNSLIYFSMVNIFLEFLLNK